MILSIIEYFVSLFLVKMKSKNTFYEVKKTVNLINNNIGKNHYTQINLTT